jgi:hypothetical protein
LRQGLPLEPLNTALSITPIRARANEYRVRGRLLGGAARWRWAVGVVKLARFFAGADGFSVREAVRGALACAALPPMPAMRERISGFIAAKPLFDFTGDFSDFGMSAILALLQRLAIFSSLHATELSMNQLTSWRRLLHNTELHDYLAVRASYNR